MGPFSNNSPQPSHTNNSTKLPIPDIEGASQNMYAPTEPDNTRATKKWLIVTLIIAGIMAAAALIAFLIFLFVSNTPGYVLNAAMQNMATSDGEAGTITYQSKQGQTVDTLTGTFMAYVDPTNPDASTATLSLGPSGFRVSATAKLFPDGNYVQFAGLSQIATILNSIQGDSSIFTPDRLTRLSSLEGQWYTLADDDVFDSKDTLPSQVKGGPTSKDIETLRQLYLKHPFITVRDHLPDEQIEGAASMHLRIGFDQAKLGQFLRAVKDANMASLQLSDEDIAEFESDKKLNMDNPNIEVWIAKSDRTFRQIRMRPPQSDTDSNTLTILFQSEQVAAQRQAITKPESVQNITVLLRGIFEIMLSPSATSPAQ